jgi:hypothetical protein
MNVLMLAAGRVPQGDGGGYPPCLAEFQGKPLIERLFEACVPLQPRRLIVAFAAAQVREHHLDRVAALLWPGATVLTVNDTHGAACTALLACGHIDNDEELLVVNGNELLDADFDGIVEGFRRRGLDAGAAVFPSVHPRYSYVKVDAEGLVVEASEKVPVSRHATAGFYWFARGSDFVRAAKNLIRKDACVNGDFYICPTFNELVLEHKRIGIHAVDAACYHPLKTGRQIEQFEGGEGRGAAERAL